MDPTGIKETAEDADDKGQPKPGLFGALMGRVSSDSDSQSSSSGNGITKESPLSPPTVMGAESAEREARPAMPAGLGPSTAGGNSSGSAASSPIKGPGSLEMSGSGSASGREGAGQRSPAVRSMILEKPPSFKVGAVTLHVLFRGTHAKIRFGHCMRFRRFDLQPWIEAIPKCISMIGKPGLVQVRSQLPGQSMAGRMSNSVSRARLRVSSLDAAPSASDNSKRSAGSVRPAANVR